MIADDACHVVEFTDSDDFHHAEHQGSTSLSHTLVVTDSLDYLGGYPSDAEVCDRIDSESDSIA